MKAWHFVTLCVFTILYFLFFFQKLFRFVIIFPFFDTFENRRRRLYESSSDSQRFAPWRAVKSTDCPSFSAVAVVGNPVALRQNATGRVWSEIQSHAMRRMFRAAFRSRVTNTRFFAFGAFAFFTHKASEQFLFALLLLDLHVGELLQTIATEL